MTARADARWDEREFFEAIAPLAALEQSVASGTALRPTAVMVPLSFAPGAEAIHGWPVVRGDRFALLYEPPRPRYT